MDYENKSCSFLSSSRIKRTGYVMLADIFSLTNRRSLGGVHNIIPVLPLPQDLFPCTHVRLGRPRIPGQFYFHNSTLLLNQTCDLTMITWTTVERVIHNATEAGI